MKPTVKETENYLKELDNEAALAHLHQLQNEYQGFDKLIQKYEKKKAARDKEYLRLKNLYRFEDAARQKGYRLIAGVDEVGRGPLAGPVVTAAVILPEEAWIEGINDSKKLSEKQREKLFQEIKEKAVAYEIGWADEKCIDDINILNATKKAMGEALRALDPQPDYILLDAVRLESMEIPQEPIIGGDAKSCSIAAASILAKVVRDSFMDEMDKVYPQYGFSRNKGYGTEEHINAIKKYGICPIHRISFTKNFV